MTVSVNGTIRLAPPSDRVAVTTADDLVTAARDVASSVADPRIGRAERLARAGVVARHARDIGAAARLMDPYGSGTQHSKIRDLLALSGHRQWGYGVDHGDAAERVAQAAQHQHLQAQLRAVAWADLTGLTSGTPTVAAPLVINPAAWLNQYAMPAVVGPATEVPGSWDSIPPSSIDPQPGDTLAPGGGVLDGERLDWTLSASWLDESQQLADWSVAAATEIERRLANIVDVGLEKALLGKITTGITASADFGAAEAAVGATGFAADLVLANPEDAPAVRREYAAEGLWPAPLIILPTAGATAGTAVVMASAAVYLECTALDFMIADRPRELGKDVACLRYGRASLRMTGAVATVTVGVTP